MRIAVVANCQGEGISAALKSMNPALDTSFVFSTEIQKGAVDVNKMFHEMDFVLTQKNIINEVPDGMESKLRFFPNIIFDGYHPDITFLRGQRKGGGIVETITNDMVIYHSSIAFFGYYFDLSIEDTLTYYNHYVASRLGYFERWNSAREALLAEGEAVGMPLGAEFYRWASQGCFMYSSNHPHLRVLVDISRRIMNMLNLEIVHSNITDYLADKLKTMPVWPLYPPIARKLGLHGDYTFKRHEPHGLITLREFVERSYAIYDQYERDSLESLTVSPNEMSRMLYDIPKKTSDDNPYRNADRRQFWKNSVASIEIEHLDPVFSTKFLIDKKDKIATAGSCFAQHIARTLSSSGFDYHVTEKASSHLSAEEAYSRNYGVFSARYGNIYTARQLVQLIDRAYGSFVPDEQYWLRADGKYIDPFRPQIEPNGFDDLAALQSSRNEHLVAVRAMIESMDVFIFTLGLTEGWRSKVDGAVFPLAPGVAGGKMDFDRYEFLNFSVEEVTSDIFHAIDLIRAINPDCRVILTVSPVPLIATYEHQHALTATTYSKSVLRTAAQRVSSVIRDVDYFGSYEIITGSYNRGAYFHDDLRSVTNEGVQHVMQVFMNNYVHSPNKSIPKEARNIVDSTARSSKLFDIVCDEEAIANF